MQSVKMLRAWAGAAMVRTMSIDIGSAVSAVAAVLSMVGAVFAWWRSNLSRAAKTEAEAARERAERDLKATEEQASAARKSAYTAEEQATHLEAMLEEVRAQSGSLDRIAASSARRPLEAEHVRGVIFRLRNNTDTDMVIEQVDNRNRFAKLEMLDAGKTIRAGESVEFGAGGASGLPMPLTLFIGMVGEDRPHAVELPPRPLKAAR